jgi:hypothetical protein
MPCPYCNQYSPEEYYKIACELDQFKGKIFTVFGKKPEEILTALQLYDKIIVNYKRKIAIS